MSQLTSAKYIPKAEQLLEIIDRAKTVTPAQYLAWALMDVEKDTLKQCSKMLLERSESLSKAKSKEN